MQTDFKIEYLSEEELRKPKVLQKPMTAWVSINGDMALVDALIAFIKTKYLIS